MSARKNVSKFVKRWTSPVPGAQTVISYKGTPLYYRDLVELLSQARAGKDAARRARRAQAHNARLTEEHRGLQSKYNALQMHRATAEAVRLPTVDEEQAEQATVRLTAYLQRGGHVEFAGSNLTQGTHLGDDFMTLLNAVKMLPVRTKERRVARAAQQEADRELTAERSAHIHTKDRLAEAERIIRSLRGINDTKKAEERLQQLAAAARALPTEFQSSTTPLEQGVKNLADAYYGLLQTRRRAAGQIPQRFKNGNGTDLDVWTQRLKEAWQTAAQQPHPDQLAADLQQGVNAVNNLLEAVREVVRKNG